MKQRPSKTKIFPHPTPAQRLWAQCDNLCRSFPAQLSMMKRTGVVRSCLRRRSQDLRGGKGKMRTLRQHGRSERQHGKKAKNTEGSRRRGQRAKPKPSSPRRRSEGGKASSKEKAT